MNQWTTVLLIQIIRINPPYRKEVSTNNAKHFVNLLDQHFLKQHRLHKIVNRKNVKVIYSSTENMPSFISYHNKKLLNSRTWKIKPCNCTVSIMNVLAQYIVCKCIASISMNPEKTYLGTAEVDFKKRYNNHKKSFRHKRYSKDTTLSK